MKLALLLGIIGAAIMGIIGWVLNIIALLGTGADITAMFVLRCIGIFVAPLGAILGWFA